MFLTRDCILKIGEVFTAFIEDYRSKNRGSQIKGHTSYKYYNLLIKSKDKEEKFLIDYDLIVRKLGDLYPNTQVKDLSFKKIEKVLEEIFRLHLLSE